VGLWKMVMTWLYVEWVRVLIQVPTEKVYHAIQQGALSRTSLVIAKKKNIYSFSSGIKHKPTFSSSVITFSTKSNGLSSRIGWEEVKRELKCSIKKEPILSLPQIRRPLQSFKQVTCKEAWRMGTRLNNINIRRKGFDSRLYVLQVMLIPILQGPFSALSLSAKRESWRTTHLT
jgi:hypothetical protein